jgi:hypothetical protein
VSATDAALEAFELSLFGGAVERRYRKLRPEVERLAWGTLRPERHPPKIVAAAKELWTEAAFQEHRTGMACAATLRALIAARAPLDLIALASRFPLDELAHTELCARLANELGGAVRIMHDPHALIAEPSADLPVLLQAADLVVRNFCIGEALSIPLLRGSWHAAKNPLVKQVLGVIVKDEAAHGQFGWMFLDWADDRLNAEARAHLGRVAHQAITAVTDRWKSIKPQPEADAEALGWMESVSYVELARRSLQTHVLAPLRERGIDPGLLA